MYRLRCFGTMCLEDDEGDELHLRSRKHSALLLYLLAHRGRAFPRERLAALFWDTEARLARHSLSQALYDIRTTLPGVEFDASTSRVGAGAERITYDGEAFEEAVRANDLAQAVRMYGGRFAPDVEDAGYADFTRWLESERQRYRRMAETALYRHVRASDEQADWGEMCVSALQLLEMNPLSEDAHRAFMRGLWLQGDRAAAVRHFEEVEEFLSRELPGGISEETFDLAERVRSSRPAAASSSASEQRRPEMVGREEEFEALKRALDDVREEGRSVLVRVRGEAGMGKTRLLEEFRGLAALDGTRLLESRCYAAESEVPYGPVVDGLEGLADEVSRRAGAGEGLGYDQLGHLFPDAFDRPDRPRDAFSEPDAGRRRLYEEAADLLRRSAEERPITWLVEDVHWIDSSSASLLHYVARRLVDRPFLLVVTARTHEEPTGAARELLDEDPGSLERVEDVALAALDREQTAELVASVRGSALDPDTADRIHLLAGGNPYYALELLRSSAGMDEEHAREALEEGSKSLITKSLRTLLERRLRGLAPEAVRIMEIVAVAGRHATPSLIADTADLPADRLAELAGTLYSRGLLRDADGRLEFFHDITRDYVYGDLGALQRSALHGSVGRLLADRDRGADPGTLARHFGEAGDEARAYEYALDAAREAERRHAHEEAIQMSQMALDLAADDEAEAEVLWVLGRAEFAGSQFDAARKHLNDLHALMSESGDDATSSRLDIKLARIAIELGRWGEARDWLDKADQKLPPSGGEHLERKLECLHLQLKRALLSNDNETAGRIRDSIQNIGRQFGDQGLSATSRALIESSLAAYELYCESALKAQRRLQSLAELDGLPPSVKMSCLQLKGAAELQLTWWNQSRGTFRNALRMAKSHNDIVGQMNATNNLMCVGMDTGDFKVAMDHYRQAVQIQRAVPETTYCRIPQLLNVAEIRLLQGKYRVAARNYRQLKRRVDRHVDGECIFTPSVFAGLGLSSLAMGQYYEAEQIFDSMDGDAWDIPNGFSSRDTIIWFRGFMQWQEDPEGAAAFMKEKGQKEVPRHKMVAYRILWLVDLFSEVISLSNTERSTDLYNSDAAHRLRDINNRWFLRFSKRWLTATLSHC